MTQPTVPLLQQFYAEATDHESIQSSNATTINTSSGSLHAGVDLTRLHQFLSNQPVGFHTSPANSRSLQVAENVGTVENAALRINSKEATIFDCSNANVGQPSNFFIPQNLGDDCNTESNNFFDECGLQLNTLFTFIQTNTELIQSQLDGKNDDNYAHSQTIASGIQDEASVSRESLRENLLFCERALDKVQQLKHCLMVNLSQLQSIIEHYEQAFPEERKLVEKLIAAKRNAVYELTEKLEQCQVDVRDHKNYLEARLTVVGWKDLMKPQHKQLTVFALVHFIVFLLATAVLTWFAGYRDRYIGLFYLYRGPMFIILYLYFYSLNLVGWATANIKYIDIFGFSSAQETPTPYVIFNIAGILSLTFTLFVSALLFTVQLEDSQVSERILPLILWVITAAVLINPFKWLIRKGRWGIFKVTVRVLLAPFYPVIFGDFWFADQLNSIVVIFLDFEFMLCFYSYVWPLDKNEDGAVCNRNNYVVRPVISCLPAFWRLMQCLRCYYDTRRYLHLINAGKYFTTFPVVILFSLFTINRQSLTDSLYFKSEGALLLLWVASSIIQSVYTFVWDVYMDWGLFQSRDLLRPRLGYQWKLVYYLAIFEDFILRFAWSFRISLGLQLEAKVNLLYTSLAGLEIFRRFVWNFFRVEHAHVQIISQLKKDDQGVLYMDTVV